MGFLENIFGRKKGRIGQTWDDALDVAVITTREVMDRTLPVVLVIHDEGVGRGWGGWQFMDGRPMEGREPVAISKLDIIRLDPTLAHVTDLRVGWRARRDGRDGAWIREPLVLDKGESTQANGSFRTDENLSAEASTFLDAAIEEFNQKMEALDLEWHFKETERWDFDQDSGVFTLRLPSGKTVLADAHTVGSFCERDRSWEWAWNNPNCTAKARKACSAVKAWGEKHGIVYLTDGVLSLPDAEFASFLTAIGIKILGAEGAYYAQDGDMTYVIALRNLRWQAT
jgi:hypothetical protein